MRRKNLPVTGIFILTSALSVMLTGCGTASKVSSVTHEIINAVKLPDQYFISYEVENADGSISSISKGVNADGDIFFSNGTQEMLFTAQPGGLLCYTGEDFLESEVKSYTAKYVEQETAAFLDYAEKSKIVLSGASVPTGEAEIAGRSCKTYEINVTFVNFTQSYTFAVDTETGICLSWQADTTVSGYHADSDEKNFRCTEFTLDDVKLPDVRENFADTYQKIEGSNRHENQES